MASRPRPARRAAEATARRPAPPVPLAAIAVPGLPLIALYGVGLVSPVSLVAIPTTLFLAVYLGSMARGDPGAARPGPAGRRSRDGRHAVMLAYCGWALAVPAAIIAVVTVTGSIRRSR